MAVYTDSELNNPIRGLDESWEGHTHQEVESFVSGILKELTDDVSVALTIGIVGDDTKIFLTDATTATFQYMVDYLVDGNTSTNYSVNVKIGNTVIQSGYKPGVGPNTPITSPELITYLRARGNSVVVTIEVYDEDSGFSRSRSVTFNKRQANIVSNNSLGTVWTTASQPQLSYTKTISYGSLDVSNIGQAKIVSTFTDSAGTVEVVETPFAAATNPVRVTVPTTLANGACSVESHIVLGDPQGTVGNSVTDSIIIVHDGTDGISSPEEGTIYLTVGDVVGATVNNYASVSYNIYVVGGAASLRWPIVLQKQINGVYVDQAKKYATNNTVQTWNYLVTDASTNLRILVPNLNADGTIYYDSGGNISARTWKAFTLTAGVSDIGWLSATDGLVFSLSALNKSNEDYDVGVWANNGYSAVFEDMQWDGSGSGWAPVTYKDYDGNTLTSNALRLVGKSRMTIGDFFPFYKTTQYSADNKVGGGILDTGGTLKISFLVDNVADAHQNVISCWDGVVGFYVTGDGFYLNIGNELINNPNQNQAISQTNTRRFQSGVKVDLTIVIPRYYDTTGAATNREVFYYINGEVAGYTRLDAAVYSLSQLLATPVTFGGDGAVLNIFDIKYWNRPLSALEVFHTYTMNLDSSAQINGIFEKNNFYSESNGKAVVTITQAIAYGKYLAELGKKNFAVWASTNLCNAEDGVPIAAGKESTKDKTTRGEKFYYFRFTTDAQGRGIIDPELSFFLDSDTVSAGDTHSALRFRRQGTSTVDATKGNIRIDVQTKDRVKLHRFLSEAAGFNPEHESLLGKKAKIWQIPDASALPCYLLTLKKNPNDSTQARNLPTAKWYEDCARYLAKQNDIYLTCLTKPQRVEYESIVENRADLVTKADRIDAIKTRQCVDGIPTVGFRINYDYANDDATKYNPLNDSVTSFGGQFDAITDKTNMDVFGFGLRTTQDASGHVTQIKLGASDEDFSLEWRNNGSDVCCFQTQDLSGSGTSITYGGSTYGSGYLEYRYPTDSPYASGEDMPTYPWQDESIYGHVTIGLENNGPIQRLFDLVATCSPLKSNVEYSTSLRGKYYWEGQEYTDAQGRIPIRDAEDNIVTWVEDSEANRRTVFRQEFPKCVNLYHFLLNALLIDAGLMVDQDVKNQFFTYFTGDVDANGHKLLSLLGYDFDSSWGMDNDNNFRFKYTVKYSDGLYDGNGSKSNLSMLWKLVYDCYGDELTTIAGVLYSGGLLNYSGVSKYMFENEIDIFNSIIYNNNSEYSYMDSSSSNWPKVHGSAKEHNEWFVEGRMYFIGGEYMAASSDLRADTAYFNPRYVSPSETFYSNPFFALRRQAGNHGLYFQLGLTTYQRSYALMRVGQDNYGPKASMEVTTEYDGSTGLPTGNITYGTGYIGMPNYTESPSDWRLYIVGCKNIKTISGLPYLFLDSIQTWGNLVNIESLELGSTETMVVNEVTYNYENPYLSSLNTQGVIFGACKTLNLAGLSGLTGVLSLASFPILETFTGIRMPNVTSISHPAGSSLRAVSYPANLQSWVIDNKPNLNSITFEGYSSIGTISVTKSSAVAAKKAIELLHNLTS